VISDNDLRKTVQECLNDPEYGELFRGLFIRITHMQAAMEGKILCPSCKQKTGYDKDEDQFICSNSLCKVARFSTKQVISEK
jgi:hypothetical protein